MDTEDRLAYWIRRLLQPSWYGRRGSRRAAEELGASGDRRALEPLLEALREADPFTREAAARALGQLGDRRAVDGLLAALHDPWWNVRAAACQALGQLRDRRAWEPLLVHLMEVIHFTVEFRGSLLAVRDTEVFQALLRLEPGNLDRVQAIALIPADQASWLAAVLWAHHGRAAWPALQRALQHSNPQVRRAACQALGLLAEADGVPALAERLLCDEAAGVRQAAAQALAAIGPAAEPALAAVLQQGSGEVRRLARNALRRIASRSAIARLGNRALSLVEGREEARESTGRELAEASKPPAGGWSGRELEWKEEGFPGKDL